MSMPPSTPCENREVVITFDQFCGGQPMGPLPKEYAGFSWSESAWFMTRAFYPSLRSGPITLFNARGEDLFFEREESFILKDLLLFALWEDSITVRIEGWEQGRSQCSESIALRRSVAVRPELGFANIHRVNLKAGGSHLAIQTITIIEKA